MNGGFRITYTTNEFDRKSLRSVRRLFVGKLTIV